MADYSNYRKYLNEIGGTKRVQVRLGAIYEALYALENGDIIHAIALLKTMAAVEDRQNLRRVRDEVYNRLKHAEMVGDSATAAAMREHLDLIREAQSSLTA